MNIVIIGSGGHSKVVRDIISSKEDYCVKAVLDDKYDQLTSNGDIYTGPISSAQHIISLYEGIKFIIAIGNNEIRQSIVSKLGLSHESYISLVHETAVISPSAFVGSGTVIMANAVVQADAIIGRYTIINTSAIIEHDNCIGDYVHIAPRATLTGDVKVKHGCMIGAGATIIPGLSIGERSVIGAGSTVIHSIPSDCTAVGIPAKVINKNKRSMDS
ncbi:acetyltransferase [Paenibacillus sp. 1_12]|uniref:acetyltransferase n=1 Tax=Paenibacillus sp. 1_12 TaxID=1566278 RepID=UPI000B809375|nr:acetyltransferase [Paenibacillus sp. 1_12]